MYHWIISEKQLLRNCSFTLFLLLFAFNFRCWSLIFSRYFRYFRNYFHNDCWWLLLLTQINWFGNIISYVSIITFQINFVPFMLTFLQWSRVSRLSWRRWLMWRQAGGAPLLAALKTRDIVILCCLCSPGCCNFPCFTSAGQSWAVSAEDRRHKIDERGAPPAPSPAQPSILSSR